MKVTKKIPQIVQTYMKLEEADKAKEETAAARQASLRVTIRFP